MNGAADWAATILAALIIFILFAKAIDWMADRLISAIKWMTRHER